MPIPEIPGYYFDKEKKKYFKITNGSLLVNNNYHNNIIQSKKRKIISLEDSSTRNKNPSTDNKGNYLSILKDERQYCLINLRLGFSRMNTTNDYLFGMLKYLKLPQSLIFDKEVDIIDSLDNSLFINDFNTTIKIVSLQNFYEKNLHTGNTFQDIKIQTYYNEMSRRFTLIRPRLTSTSVSKNLIFKSIIINEINSNIMINFVKLHLRNLDSEESDLTINLIKSCARIKDRVIKGKLSLLFGCNFTLVEGNSYFYNSQTLYNSNCFITFSNFINNQLVLGNNSGEVFWIDMESDYNFKRVKMIKVSKHLISLVQFYENNWFVANGSNVNVYNGSFKFRKAFKHSSKITNFILFQLNILIIGLKGLSIRSFEGMNSSVELNYTNHNIVNQISKLIANNLVVNESNSNLLVYNLNTMENCRIHLDTHSKDKLQGITQVNNGSELILKYNMENNKTKFLIYKL